MVKFDDIPPYVPEGARSFARRYLGEYGPQLIESENKLYRLAESIRECQKQLAETSSGEISESWHKKLRTLQQQSQGQSVWRDGLVAEIECIRRVIYGQNMKEVYRILADAFFADVDEERNRKYDGFLWAAWSARVDYRPSRDRLKRVEKQCDEIADAADKLSKLLCQICGEGLYPPRLFFSIPDLLRETENYDSNDHNLNMWRDSRGYILGDSPLRIESEEDNSQERVGEVSKHKSTTQFVKTGKEAEEDPVEQERALIRAIWQSAPSLSSILDTVKIAAQNWTPSEIGFIRAAIASRKKNPKTEYVRGFGDLLKKTHGFTLTPQLMKAMALTATVVITDKDLVVTYDDVRKALQNKGENSSNE